MFPMNPYTMKTRVVKVVYDFDAFGMYIDAAAGEDMICPTSCQYRCQFPLNPNMAAGAGYDDQAHGMSYWATYYAAFQTLAATCYVVYEEIYESDTSTKNLETGKVLQLSVVPSPVGFQTDYESNMFRKYVKTRMVKPYNPQHPSRVSMSNRWDYKLLHGPTAEPSIQPFTATTSPDNDAFLFSFGNESKIDNAGGVFGRKFNIHTRVIYTIRLLEPLDVNNDYSAVEAAPTSILDKVADPVEQVLWQGTITRHDVAEADGT